MDKVREEFEKWILRKFHNRNYLNKDKDGFYTNLLTAGAWASWQEKQKRVGELEQRLHNIYMNAESNCCDSCKYAESEAISAGCGF
ncbi:hypothetical protein [Acinetobacter guerrae]|uniref:hypothetical protein n=1 Tax=Acinetobacter guerrae TaxID=1843371 RepID=UPI00128B1E0A|nr:hypothetical protein [Acinetobacter guerrae]MPW43355.1 hypothetical protein [Acinetobacter guerrae]